MSATTSNSNEPKSSDSKTQHQPDQKPQTKKLDDHAATPSASSLDDQVKAALKAHNDIRFKHGCDPLTWDSTLASAAQGYAEHIANINKAEHGDTQGQGESIYWVNAADATFEQAVHRWTDEEKGWTLGQKYGEGDIQHYGHFTQCTWRNTTHVGMGKAKSHEGVTYVVARYMAPGNVFGEQPF